MNNLSRRLFLKISGAALLVPEILSAQNRARNFSKSFQVPPLYSGTKKGNDVFFDLTLQKGKQSFLPNLHTETFGINGNYLGPTLRISKGDTAHITVKNQIGETSTLHWHGMTLPAKMDGGPHQPIQHGASWKSEFEIRQPASTLWYHSHQLHKTAEQVYKGLAGFFILDDEESKSLDLPSNYGVDDIPVVLQDREFNDDGSFNYDPSMHEKMRGKRGDQILINGVIAPVLKAEKSLLRFRILNGSNARIYNLVFDDQRHFHVIAGDCGLLAEPVSVQHVELAPGERVEILVDVSDGKPALLKNLDISTSRSSARLIEGMESLKQEALFRIDSEKAQKSAHQIPGTLMTQPVHAQESVAKVRRMSLNMKMGLFMLFGGNEMFSINGKSMDMERIDEVVQTNSLEIWELTNHSSMAHPFHIHNVQFQVLNRNNTVPKPHESGLKDTILVNPNDRIKILIPFPDYSDPETPYMYHCHILEHEDGGMMGQFVVVDATS